MTHVHHTEQSTNWTLRYNSDPAYNSFDNSWHIPRDKEHPFIESIRAAVLRYHILSASHFAIPINVYQIAETRLLKIVAKLTRSFRVQVGFNNLGHKLLHRNCRPKFLKSPARASKEACTVIYNIEVCENGKFIPLEDFLGVYFQTLDTPVGDLSLCQWWWENGKRFNWLGMPTELKEHIVQCCMHEQPMNGNYNLSLPRKYQRGVRRGANEITTQLGSWSSLLRVSHQVRAIALRLCFVKTGDSMLDQGLCIHFQNHYQLKDCMRRLGNHYQLSEPNGLPVDEHELVLAETYKHYPKIFPQLAQYATFRHGVRKIHMQLSFLTYLHFFKITTGDFQRYWNPRYLDYEVFELLPHLSELIIDLPDARGKLVDKSFQQGPPLFYPGFECPRILHRLIYERATEVLAPYPNVGMCGFVDELEELRFKALRKTAVEALRFTSADLEELYAEDGGGVELEYPVYVDSHVPYSMQELEQESDDTWGIPQGPHDFWPPKCRCEVLCDKLLFPEM